MSLSRQVLSASKPRMSISGWYHAGEAPEGSEQASLKQLQLKAGEDAAGGHQDFEGGWGCWGGVGCNMQDGRVFRQWEGDDW